MKRKAQLETVLHSVTYAALSLSRTCSHTHTPIAGVRHHEPSTWIWVLVWITLRPKSSHFTGPIATIGITFWTIKTTAESVKRKRNKSKKCANPRPTQKELKSSSNNENNKMPSNVSSSRLRWLSPWNMTNDVFSKRWSWALYVGECTYENAKTMRFFYRQCNASVKFTEVILFGVAFGQIGSCVGCTPIPHECVSRSLNSMQCSVLQITLSTMINGREEMANGKRTA